MPRELVFRVRTVKLFAYPMFEGFAWCEKSQLGYEAEFVFRENKLTLERHMFTLPLFIDKFYFVFPICFNLGQLYA